MLDPMDVEETSFSFSRRAPSPPPQRRRDTRHLKILRVGTMISEGKRELCLIRNISAGGLMAHVYSPYQVGQQVGVALKSHTPLEGHVAWSKDGNVGIEFHEPIDVEEMLSNQTSLENGWVPRMPRVEIDRLATVRCGAQTIWVTLRDISQGGVKLEADQPLPVDQPVVLTIDKFRSINGVVRWFDDGVGGLSFNEPIPFQELMGWLRVS